MEYIREKKQNAKENGLLMFGFIMNTEENKI